MKDASWINHPALKNLDTRKLDVIMELMNQSEGISLDKSLPLLLNANAKLRSQNLSFTQEETSVIIELLTKNMTPDEKVKFNNIKNLMDSKLKGFKR